jgi:hypothetical protein
LTRRFKCDYLSMLCSIPSPPWGPVNEGLQLEELHLLLRQCRFHLLVNRLRLQAPILRLSHKPFKRSRMEGLIVFEGFNSSSS